jgi:hypothetical protein
MVNHDYPLTIQNKLKPSSSLLMAPSRISSKGWARVLPLHGLFFGFCTEVMDPWFILCYDPVDNIRLSLVARQTICWNVKPGPFLVFSQLLGDSSSGNLWHAIDWTKAYTHFPSNASQVSPHVAHDQIVHSFGSFIIVAFGRPGRSRSSSPMLSSLI